MAVPRTCLPALVLVLLPAALAPRPALSEGRPSALLVVDPSARDLPASRLRALRDRLGEAYRILAPGDLPVVPRADPTCTAEGDAAARDRALAELRRGSRLFYDDTEIPLALEALARGLDQWVAAPCAAGRGDAGRAEACSAAVLRVRLELMQGRPEAAAAAARQLVRAFAPGEVAAVDAPPDVTGFLDQVRRDAEATAAPLTVTATPPDRGATARMLVDGRPLPPSGTVAVPPGDHQVTILLPSGPAVTARVVTTGRAASVEVDLDLAAAVGPGPEGTWELRVPQADRPSPALLDRLSALAGAQVLAVTGEEGGWVARVFPGGREALRMRPGAPDRIDLTLAGSGPLAERPSWPWPWATGSLAAGLLGAGIALNVLANRSADQVNDGVNRLSDWRGRRAGAIACYALSGAAAVGTVLLVVLRPGPRSKIRLEPLAGGAAVGFDHAF